MRNKNKNWKWSGVFLLVLFLSLSFAKSGFADEVKFDNPLIVNDMTSFLQGILTYMGGLVVGLALLFVVLGGVLYMLSGGDPGMVKRAKNCWVFALVGFAIVVAAPTFLDEIVAILGGPEVFEPDGTPISLEAIVTNVLNLLLSILGMLCIISLTVAGGMYLTAYGEDERIKTAKKIAQYSVVGLVVALSSLIVIEEVEGLISG